MNKIIGGSILVIFSLSLMVVPVFADNYSYLTFQDSADFVVIKPQLSSETVTAVGFDGEKLIISDPENIRWSSSNPNVAYVTPSSGATVDIWTLAERGDATVTARYVSDNNTPRNIHDDTVCSCSVKVIVDERTVNPVNEVNDVDVIVKGSNGSGIDINLADVTIPKFNLTEVFGSAFNDDDVLKMNPTALHALLYVLELEKDDDNYTYGDPNWDWDWVPTHVTLDSEGSYVKIIDGDGSNWPIGWNAEVDGELCHYPPSISPVSANGSVYWHYYRNQLYNSENFPYVPVLGVTMNKQELNLAVGEEMYLQAEVTPDDASIRDIEWSSSNGEIATAWGGHVCAKKVGTCEIKATSMDKHSLYPPPYDYPPYSDMCIVHVYDAKSDYQYNDVNQLTNIKNSSGTSYTYQYDANGNLLSRTEAE